MASEADMPPPLEDMTATLEQAKKLRDLRIGAKDPSTAQLPRNAEKKIHSSKSTSTTSPSPSQQESTANSKAASSSKATPDAQPSTSSAAPENVNSTKSTSTSMTPGVKSGSGDFGGMRKGFLFGGGPSTKTAAKQQPAKGASMRKGDNSGKANTSAQAESIPFITAKPEEQKSGLKLDQVQEAMKTAKGLLQDKDWVTEDLLEKVQKNEMLSKRFGDPRFMQAITEFQHNPQEAIKKYEGSPEITTFLTEFCGLLGAHFTSLGCKQDKTNSGNAFFNPPQTSGPKITEVTDEDRSQGSSAAPPPPVDPHVQQILEDPANRELLMDPKIQQLIQHLRSSPEQAQKMLREGDREFKQKLDRLISLGLLKFQG